MIYLSLLLGLHMDVLEKKTIDLVVIKTNNCTPPHTPSDSNIYRDREEKQ